MTIAKKALKFGAAILSDGATEGGDRDDKYFAYNRSLPCQNPSCKSYGKPHPNCRCYSHMAQGGETDFFCSENRRHSKDCEYYQDGGDVEAPDTLTPEEADIPIVQESEGNPPQEAPDTLTPEEADIPIVQESEGNLPQDAPDTLTPEEVDADSAPATLTLEEAGFRRGSVQNPIHMGDSDYNWNTPIGATAIGHQGKAAASGILHALFGPLVDLGEKLLPEDVQKLNAESEKAYPMTKQATEVVGLIGSLYLGIGQAALAETGATSLAKFLRIGNISKLFEDEELARKSAVTATKIFTQGANASALSLGDEASQIVNASLGNDSDAAMPTAENVLLHAGGAFLFGAATQGGFSLAGAGASRAAKFFSPKAGENLMNYATGIGLGGEAAKRGLKAADVPAKTILNKWLEKGFLHGLDLDNQITQMLYRPTINALAGAAGTAVGHFAGPGFGAATTTSILGSSFFKPVRDTVQKLLYPFGRRAAQKFAPNIMDYLSKGGQAENIANVINTAGKFSNATARGAARLTTDVNTLFQSGEQVLGNGMATDANREALKSYMDNSQLDQELNNTQAESVAPIAEGYAEGGEVKKKNVSGTIYSSNGIPEMFPIANTALQAAKGRVYSYLKQLKPVENTAKLAFDSEPDQTERKKSYYRAIDIALDPSSVLKHVKDGTLEPEHLQHLSMLYPEVKEHMAKQLTARIIDAQMAGEMPEYKIRQGLSALMGVPLDGVLAQPNIQAAQSCFAPKQAQQPQGSTKAKKGTSTLTKASSAYLTGDQARAERQNRD